MSKRIISDEISSSTNPKRTKASMNQGNGVHKFLKWTNCNAMEKSRYNVNLVRLMIKPFHVPYMVDWNLLKTKGLDTNITKMMAIRPKRNIGIPFVSHAWWNAFSINEPISKELCLEFFATFEFNNEPLGAFEQLTQEIIKFRLGGETHTMTLSSFAIHLGLYYDEETYEEGFDQYFLEGLKSDEGFDADEYWKKISNNAISSYITSSVEEVKDPILKVLLKMITLVLFQKSDDDNNITRKDLWILSMFEEHHQHGYANVAWLIATRLKEIGTKNQILCGQLVSKLGKSLGVLTEEVIQSLKTPIQMKVLDSEVIGNLDDSKNEESKETIMEGSRMDQLEANIKKIEGIMTRQSYQLDRYAPVLERIGTQIGINFSEPYNPPGYI